MNYFQMFMNTLQTLGVLIVFLVMGFLISIVVWP